MGGFHLTPFESPQRMRRPNLPPLQWSQQLFFVMAGLVIGLVSVNQYRDSYEVGYEHD